MATGPNRGRGRQKLGTGHDSSRSGALDTGLPLLPPDPQGSHRDTRLWDNGLQQGLGAPVRDSDGGSAAREKRGDNQSAVPRDSGGLRAGGEWNGADNNGSQARSLSGIKVLELTELPDVPHGYRQPAKEATAGASASRFCDGDGFLVEGAQDKGGKLDSLVDLALDTLREVMETPTPDIDDEAFGRILSAKKDAAVSVVNSGLKADENRFRKRSNDILQKLFDKVQAQKKLNSLVIENPEQVEN